ncbi:MAG: hypothetical protein ABSF28_19780 [Terracidiphilus sp.]|jgi:hypothetical protein
MPSAITKQEYRAPADILEQEVERLGKAKLLAPLAVSPAPIVGTWVNCDHQTRGLIRVVIAAKGNEVTVHAFGACQPTPCDWGMVNGLIFADNVTDTPAVAFTALYTFNFKQTTIIGRLQNGALMVETFDHFTDQSGRADYYSLEIMSQ